MSSCLTSYTPKRTIIPVSHHDNIKSYFSHHCTDLSRPGHPEANDPTRVISNFKWPPSKPYLGIVLNSQSEPNDLR